MFLGVSATLCTVEMNEEQRSQLAELVKSQRSTQFGTKSAAYIAAGLNSATWDRIEQGLAVRDDRLVAALKTLWPESRGDWRQVLDPNAVSFEGTFDDLLRLPELNAWMASVDAALRRLAENGERLERMIREDRERDALHMARDGVSPPPEVDTVVSRSITPDDDVLAARRGLPDLPPDEATGKGSQVPPEDEEPA